MWKEKKDKVCNAWTEMTTVGVNDDHKEVSNNISQGLID